MSGVAMKSRIASRTSVAAMASVALLAGCSGSSGAGSGGTGGGPLEKTNIVVDAFPAIDSAGLFIAEQRGLFKAQGLNVTIKLANTSQTAKATPTTSHCPVCCPAPNH